MANPTAKFFTRCQSHLANWRAWELNPIVIKELRQAVRSWAVPGVLLTFLVVLFLATLGFLINQSVNNTNRQLGAEVFGTFLGILGFMSVIFIPLYLATRLGAERQESNHDLLYISTLSPGRIIRGKFFCGAYITLLFFSACLPFMAFTNLLRGVDLPTVFGSMAMLFIAVCVLNMAAIFFACLPLSKGLKILFTAGGFMFGTGFIGSTVSRLFRFGGSTIFSFSSGGGGSLTDWFTFLAVALAFALLFYFLAVALIAPPSSNRALPVRLFLTLAWLLTGAWAAWAIYKFSSFDYAFAWAMPWLIVFAITLINIIANQDRLSPRVLRDVPQNPAKRRLAFLFFNGAAGGLLWVVLLAVLTGALAVGVTVYAEGSGARPRQYYSADSIKIITVFVSVTGYALAYALAGLFAQRRFLPHRSPKFAAIFALILTGGWAIIPSTVLFFANHLTWSTLEKFQPGNLFNVFSLKDSNDQTLHVICSAAFLLIALLLNARWFATQWKNFRPLEPRADSTQPPPLP